MKHYPANPFIDEEAEPQPHIFYCPLCGKHLISSNIIEVQLGYSDTYEFTHDDVPHSDEDMRALYLGIQ